MIRLDVLGASSLRSANGSELRSILAQPKRLALLTYLTIEAPNAFVRRDTLLGIFWPEHTQRQARQALRQAVYHIRQGVGDGVIIGRGAGELAVDPAAITCDALEFQRLVDSTEAPSAIMLYRGDLLAGLYIPDASPEFDQWLDQKRARLRQHAVRVVSDLADAEQASGNTAAALRWAQHVVSLTPDDERATRRLMLVLESLGDRVGAVRVYDAFADRLRLELDVEPSSQTRAVVKRLRAPAAVSAVARLPNADARPADAMARSPVAPPREPVAATAAPRRRLRATVFGATIGGVVLSMATIGLLLRPQQAPASVVAPASIAARALYEQGMRAYYRGDSPEAARAFVSALGHDSAFAMAGYYAFLSEREADVPLAAAHLSQAARVVRLRSGREPLLIRQALAAATNDGAMVALADSLVAIDPSDADGHYALGSALSWTGNGSGALLQFRRALALDSVGFGSASGRCLACDALWGIIAVQESVDSLAAAEATARAWVAQQPHSARPWHTLADVLASEGRGEEATAAFRRSAQYASAMGGVAYPAALQVWLDHSDEAEDWLARTLQLRPANERRDLLWVLTIALRNQGQVVRALGMARRYRALTDSLADRALDVRNAIPEAQVLLEMGRVREAAALFDSIASLGTTFPAPGAIARDRSWRFTHYVTAVAALGDTAALARLADTVASYGSRSAFARDRALHWYAEGLLWRARGHTDSAIDAFRKAMIWPVSGYTRVNLELGRALIAAHRPAEAIPVVRAALHGGIEGSNYYVTRTELHELQAAAFAAAGQVDSAAAHQAVVRRAWRRADRSFRATHLTRRPPPG
jgi:DNA-binding SARP family transcriptional activator